MNQIALFAPNNLNEEHLRKVFDFMFEAIDETSVNLLFYRTIDFHFVRFFLELPIEYSSHLTIHLPSRFDGIQDSVLKEGIEYLRSNGANVIEHFYPSTELNRNQYNELVGEIVRGVDEVISFYNGDSEQISKLLLPFDHTKYYKKIGYINHLHKNKDSLELVSYV